MSKATGSSPAPPKQNAKVQVTYAAQPQHAAHQPQIVMMGNPVAGQHHPCTVKCPFCQNIVTTRVHETWSTMDFIFLIIALVCFWPLLYILCCSPFHDINHYCTQCGGCIGKA